MDRRAVGAAGERLAEWFLARRGYRTLERNARVGKFEVDLVMEQGSAIILVEVKMRRASSWGGARGALNRAQRLRLAAAASAFEARWAGRRIRFDVITVEESEERLVVEHVRDAFGSGGELR
ncbi:MAG TPA: YraN family protein [Candidatus Eisenbacteria bacterium]|jgi:putative endonuclease|nr:YraN family protein [Candidatus Eisenbacteria bacterium]